MHASSAPRKSALPLRQLLTAAGLLLVLAAGLAMMAKAAAARPARPPGKLQLDPFYTRYLNAGGIAVIGSAQVPPKALRAARDIVNTMLARRPDLRAEIVRQDVRVAVLAPEEGTADLPENRGWKKPAADDPRLTQCERDNYQEKIGRFGDREFWNMRTRGSGGRLTSVGAENLLAIPGTRYFGENMLVHEFAHSIFDAIQVADPPLFERIARAYADAIAAGRWKGDYAAVTVQEYWAEGSQFWFESNMVSRLDDGTILSAADLERYDPALHSVLAEVYGDRHRIRADRFHNHLARLNVPAGRKSADC